MCTVTGEPFWLSVTLDRGSSRLAPRRESFVSLDTIPGNHKLTVTYFGLRQIELKSDTIVVDGSCASGEHRFYETSIGDYCFWESTWSSTNIFKPPTIERLSPERAGEPLAKRRRVVEMIPWPSDAIDSWRQELRTRALPERHE